MDDFTQARRRQAEFKARMGANSGGSRLPRAMRGTVVDNGSKPTTMPGIFAVSPTKIGGDEVEGGTPSFPVCPGVAYFTVIGSRLPQVGDVLDADLIEGRWVAESGAGCPVFVRPLDHYGHPIVGAVVTVFWNIATKGAFLDPAANDHNSGPFTTTSTGVMVPVDASNGIYMVRVVATGFATTFGFVWACGGVCNPARKLGYFQTNVNVPVTTYLTGTSIVTNVQTSPLYAYSGFGSGPQFGRIFPEQTALAPVSGAQTLIAGPVTGGAFSVSSYNLPGHPGCFANPQGTPGTIGVGCVGGSAGIAVEADVPLLFCPVTFPGGAVVTAPNTYGGPGADAILGSTVTGIQYDPFTIFGTWNTAYNTRRVVVGGSPVDVIGFQIYGFQTYWFTDPGPSLIPLSGTFTIQ